MRPIREELFMKILIVLNVHFNHILETTIPYEDEVTTRTNDLCSNLFIAQCKYIQNYVNM